jgi:hypothetical protein
MVTGPVESDDVGSQLDPPPPSFDSETGVGMVTAVRGGSYDGIGDRRCTILSRMTHPDQRFALYSVLFYSATRVKPPRSIALRIEMVDKSESTTSGGSVVRKFEDDRPIHTWGVSSKEDDDDRFRGSNQESLADAIVKMKRATLQPPDYDDFRAVRRNLIRSRRRVKPDVKFLKKMRAAPTARIDSFIRIDRKRRPKARTDQGLEVKDESDDSDYRDDDLEDDTKLCRTCNVYMEYNKRESHVACSLCGSAVAYQEYSVGDIIHQGYSPPPSYLYQRVNHFKAWILRTQAKESKCVDPEILQLVVRELQKERITDMGSVKYTKIKDILKRLRLNDYYDHCVQITCIITGKDPPRMTEMQEQTLMKLFERIEGPFERIVRGEPRQNMLSYAFVIHKLLQIQSWDEFIPYFSLPVSQDKIQYQDAIWKKLCAEVGFEYIRSTM